MRGEEQEQVVLVDSSAVIVPYKRRTSMIAANVIDPIDGSIHYHIVSTKALNLVVASLVTLVLCGLLVLGLVIYLKWDVDTNKRQIQELQQEVPATEEK